MSELNGSGLSAADDPALAELVEELTDRLNAGESVDVDAYVARHPGHAERIRGLMFTFEDLRRVDGPGVQALLRAVEKGRLALALKGASEGLRELFFRNLTERAARLLRDDIAALGPVRLRDVDEAQAAVVALAKDLAARGQLDLGDGGGEEVVA